MILINLLPHREEKRRRRKVAFFAGCIMRVAFAETNRATVRVLSRAGCQVDLPETQICCGALHVHAGEREQAKDLAKKNIEAFERSDAEWIVVNAAGCGAALKEYGELLAHDRAWAKRAEAFSSRVRDFSEVVATLDLPARRKRAMKLLVESGAPDRLIRDYVRDRGVDLVVLGTHGRSAVLNVLIGSTAKQILSALSCDALVVPRAATTRG